VWSGSGDGSTWNDTANWTGGVLPSGTNIAQFGPAGGSTQISLTSNLFAGRISLTAGGISRVIGNATATPVVLSLTGQGGIILENLGSQMLTIASSVAGGTGGMSLAVPAGVPAIHSVGDIVISANLTGQAFSKTGAGLLMLTGTNTQSGFGAVTGGTLQVGNGGTTGTVGDMHLALSTGAVVSFNRSNTLTYSLDITGTGSVTQAGTGTTIFTSSFNTYNGGTTITSGTLQIGNGGTSGVLGSGAVSIAGGATLAVNRSNNYTLGSGNVMSGAGTLQKSGAGILTLNASPNPGFTGSVSILGGTLAVQSAAGGTHSLSNAGAVTTSGPGTLSLIGGSAYTFANTISGTGGVSFSASAAIPISGSNSYTGPTTIQNASGALVVTHLADGGVNSNLGAASSHATNLVFNDGVLRYTGAGSSTDRLFSITGNNSGAFIEANGTDALEFTGTGAMGFHGQTGARFLLLQGTSAANVPNSLAMQLNDNGGPTQIWKRGGNTWLLTGTSSTHTGATLIEGGVLGAAKLAHGGAGSSIGSSSSAATSLVMSNGGLLRYTGGGDTTDRLFSIGGGSPAGGGIESAGSGAIVFTNTGDIGTGGTTILRTLTLGGSNTGENILAARYTDMGKSNTLTKSGAGKWILTANHTNTGSTSITGGTLQLGTGGTSGALGSGTIFFSNNSSLIVNRSDAVTMGQSITGAGNFTQTGGGTTTLTNTNTYSGSTTISAGALQLGNGGTAGSVASTSIVNNGTLILNRSDNLTWTTPVSGSGGFTKDGMNTVTLNASLSYTGPTSITAGKLQPASTLSLPTSSVTIAAAGTLAANGNAMSFASLNGSGTVENGSASASSTITLNGSGSFTGLLRNGGTALLSMVKTGSGTQSLDNANTFTGTVSISGGSLSTNSLANGGSASGIGAASSTPANLLLNGGTLRYTGGTTSTDRRFELGPNGGTLDASGTGAVTFAATNDLSFSAAAGPRTLTLTGTGTAANTLAARVVDGTGATSLVKDGSGTWALTNSNTYTGGTTLNAGVLRISSSSAIGSGSLTFSGGVLQTTQSMSIGNNLVVNNASNGVTVSTGVLTINGAISGSFPLYKDGPGRLVIAGGSNTVPTVVQNGTVQGSAANAGSSIALSTPAAVFEFSQSTADTYGGIISGQGGISLTGSGGLTLTGANTFDGETQVSSGVLTVVSDTALGSTTGGVSVQAARWSSAMASRSAEKPSSSMAAVPADRAVRSSAPLAPTHWAAASSPPRMRASPHCRAAP
jgi:fibronectin-binding autotransporter adhesin